MLTVFGVGFVQEHVQPDVSPVHSSAAFVPDTNGSLLSLFKIFCKSIGA